MAISIESSQQLRPERQVVAPPPVHILQSVMAGLGVRRASNVITPQLPTGRRTVRKFDPQVFSNSEAGKVRTPRRNQLPPQHTYDSPPVS